MNAELINKIKWLAQVAANLPTDVTLEDEDAAMRALHSELAADTVLKLIAKVQTPLEEHNARFAIDGAIWKGSENIDPPPTEDHWLMPYWKMARELAEFKAAAAPSPAVAVEPAQLAVATHAGANSTTIVVNLIRGDTHTCIYSADHSANGETIGVNDLPAALFVAPSPSLAVRDAAITEVTGRLIKWETANGNDVYDADEVEELLALLKKR